MTKSQKSVTLDQDLTEYVEEIAKKERSNFSAVVNRIVAEHKIKEDEKE